VGFFFIFDKYINLSMKFIYCLILLFVFNLSHAQNMLKGNVYNLASLPKMEDDSRAFRQLFKNQETEFLKKFSIHHSTLKPGHALRPSHKQDGAEELIIIHDGTLTVVIENQTKEVGPGGVLLILKGDEQQMNNLSKENVSYFVLVYTSKQLTPVKDRGVSQIVNWNDVNFKPHDKGGRRNILDRPTSMFKRLEMHVTTLNEGLKSHDPHKHVPEEIILMVDGKAKMQIGDNFYEGYKGDLFFLPSNQSHNLTNIGTGSATYFAFQFN
jgi:(S)-ureidoglycine aminohydrolase